MSEGLVMQIERQAAVIESLRAALDAADQLAALALEIWSWDIGELCGVRHDLREVIDEYDRRVRQSPRRRGGKER